VGGGGLVPPPNRHLIACRYRQLVPPPKSCSRPRMVGIDFQHFSSNVFLPLAEMKNLSSLEISTNRALPTAMLFDDDIVQKLNVTSLKCDRFSLVNFCNPVSLEILCVCVDYSTEIDELIEKLKQYRKLRVVSIELHICVRPEKLFRLVDLIQHAMQIEQFSLAIKNDFTVKKIPELAKHQGFRKSIRHLKINEDFIKHDRVEWFIKSLFRLTQLTSLALSNTVAIQIDLLLNGLQNLQHLSIDSSDCCLAPPYEFASVKVTSSYDR